MNPPLPALSEQEAQSARQAHRLHWFLGLLSVNAGALIILTFFALLRETPAFWRSAGGWPGWLRELVYTSFYPLFLSELAVLVATSVFAIASRSLKGRRALVWSLAAGLWAWTATNFAIIARNNLLNVLAGRPLHWHPM